MEIKRGDIYVANLEGTSKSVVRGKRPVLIIQNDVANKYSPTVIIAPLTSQINSPKIPTHVKILSQQTGLAKDSVVLLEQLITIDKSILIKKLTTLNEEKMKEVTRAMIKSINKINESNLYENFEEHKKTEVRTKSSITIDQQYLDFFDAFKKQSETLEEFRSDFKKTNSLSNQLVNWIVGGIIGAIFGILGTIILL